MKNLFTTVLSCLFYVPALFAQSFEAESGTLSNGASLQSCSGCSGGSQVGFLGGPSNGAVVVPVNVSTAGLYNSPSGIPPPIRVLSTSRPTTATMWASAARLPADGLLLPVPV